MPIDIQCVADVRAQVGEGALWDHTYGVLWWVDIPQGLIYAFDPERGDNRVHMFDEPVGCLALHKNPSSAHRQLIVAAKNGFYFYDPPSGKYTPLIDPETDKPEHRFNDGGPDRQGRFWAGSMYQGTDVKTPPGPARFWRLNADGTVTAGPDGYMTTNGLAFSPDGRRMYTAESHKDVQTIWQWDYDIDDGMPSNRQLFFQASAIKGRPDGGTVDADGCYWMAAVDGWQVLRLTPKGAVDRIIDLPVERPSKPMFGGKDLDTLFVTSIQNGITSPQDDAGGLFAITGLGVSGLREAQTSLDFHP
ncbi:MAG: SMP-30/gluconolactonase/LRE family protein [Pseudomonadota bacterium]